VKIQVCSQLFSKYSALAMLQLSLRGRKAGMRGGSRVEMWFAQTMRGPCRGTRSRPTWVKRPKRTV